MKIIHHNDNDGYCAAACVNSYLTDAINVPQKEDFYVYSHNLDFTPPEVKPGETVYVVDLSLDERIFSFIKYCVDTGARVIHIDHHQKTFDFIENNKELNIKEMEYDKNSHFLGIYFYGSSLTGFANENSDLLDSLSPAIDKFHPPF